MADLEEKQLRLAGYYTQLREMQGELRTYDERIMPATMIRSPISAIILKINNRVGELALQSGVVELGNTDQMQAVLQFEEGDTKFIRPGQAVTIKSENGAFSKNLNGSVRSIGLIVKAKKKLTLDPAADSDNEDRIIEVKVLLDHNSSQSTNKLTGVKVVGIIKVS